MLALFPSVLIFEFRLCAAKNCYNFFDRVPIARGDRHTQTFLDPAEVADRFHLPAIHTEDESALDRNDLQQPVIVRWQTQRNRRQLGCLMFDVRFKSERLRPRSGLANTLTNRTMFEPEGCCENGSFDARYGESVSPRQPDKARISFAGQIMISHLNGKFRTPTGGARKTADIHRTKKDDPGPSELESRS